jgi:hypothetical protein
MAGVHRGARECGRLTTRGARAAGRPHEAHRRALAGRRKRSLLEGSHLCVHSSAFALGLDRWPQRADGPSVLRRWINLIRAFAQELVGLQPEAILTGGTPVTAAVQRETRTIPIVFVGASIQIQNDAYFFPNLPPLAATSPALWKQRWRASGWSCSRRSPPALSGSRPCLIPTRSPLSEDISYPRSR